MRGNIQIMLPVLTLALAAPARGQTYEYGTPQAGLGVYADTASHAVGVAILSADSSGGSENRAEFAAAKVLAWVDDGMMDALRDGPANDVASLAMRRHEGVCTLRLTEPAHADHEIALPCHQLPAFTDGMRLAAGVTPTYFDYQVEKPASALPGSPTPIYPQSLRQARVTGTVLIQFVVDTNGKADLSTFKVLRSPDQGFSDAVRRVLPDMRYTPAEIGGHKVKQLVQEPFAFGICGEAPQGIPQPLSCTGQ
jgi:TonB family protein